MTEQKSRRVARPRTPRAVLEDLAEAERMIREVRSRYSHAYDLSYSTGSGAVAVGGSRGDLSYVRPTEDAALAEAKDRSRSEVARASRAVARLVTAAHEAHAAIVNAMPGADPYEPVWRASEEDGLATRAERAESARKQAARVARGEL